VNFYKINIYTNAFKVTGQNSFSEYFIEVIHPILLVYLNDIFKKIKM